MLNMHGKVVGVFSKSEVRNPTTGYFVGADTWRDIVQGEVKGEFVDYISWWENQQGAGL